MQSLDYKLKTSNTNYVTARHDVQYFPSSLSFFSPAISRVCRIPLTSGTSFIDPESIKIAFNQKHGRHQPAGACHSEPRLFHPKDPDLLKGREYNQNKAVEGFDMNNARTPRTVHQSGYADVLLRPIMVGILRCGKMLPPQLNLGPGDRDRVRGRHDCAVVRERRTRSNPRCLRAWRSSGARLHETQGQRRPPAGQPGAGRGPHRSGQAGRQSPGVADAAGQPEGSLGALPLPLGPCGDLRRHGAQHRHRPRWLPAPQLHRKLPDRASAQDAPQRRQHSLERPGSFTFKALDGTMTDVFIHLIAYQLVTLSGTGVSVLD